MTINDDKQRQAWRLAIAMTVVALLGACGSNGSNDDGGGGNDAGGIPVASVDEFTAWAKSREEKDDIEPLDVDGLEPPTSDVAEATALD